MTRASGTISPRQGKAIVTAVRTRERRGGRNPDCSHLVHEIYAIAGLAYPYTDSFDLFSGTENFVRVARPQPGDLVVWPGHVGIVINPTNHSFFSSLRSGLGTEFYDAPYWKARGPARFYRYVATAVTTVRLAQQRSAPPAEPVQVVSVPVVEDPHGSSSTIAAVTPTKSDTPTAAAGGYDSSSNQASIEIPSSILVATARKLPTNEDVAEAVSELNNAAGSILRDRDLAEFSRNVVIYDGLAVQHVETNGERGSAKIRIDSRVTLAGQHIDRNQHTGQVRWKLVRTTQGWKVLAQPDRVYVPRDVAVHELATRLALLSQYSGATHTNSNLSEQARIVRVLSTLMQGL